MRVGHWSKGISALIGRDIRELAVTQSKRAAVYKPDRESSPVTELCQDFDFGLSGL